MLIQLTVERFCKKSDFSENTAFTLDWVTALALIIIGALAVCSIINISMAVAGGILGAGALYGLIQLLRTGFKFACNKD